MASITTQGQAINKSPVHHPQNSIYQLADSANIKARFETVLNKNAGAYLGSVLNVVKNNKALADCEPMSIMGSALIGATLNLPIDPNLGFAAIIPYKDKGVAKAQFQIMTKGLIQLAQRSGQYKNIGVNAVYEDELKSYNPIFDEIEVEVIEGGYRSQGRDDKIVGYLAYLKLLNGFEKILYKSIAEIDAHGRKFSKTFDFKGSPWQANREAMRRKTVLKELISKWGVMSIDYQMQPMQTALKSDQAIMDGIDDASPHYVDNPNYEDTIPAPPHAQADEEAKLLDDSWESPI